LWANAISSAGDGAYIAALPLLAITVTRDPRLIALVSAAAFMPWLVLSLPAGVFVDRYDRGAKPIRRTGSSLQRSRWRPRRAHGV